MLRCQPTSIGPVLCELFGWLVTTMRMNCCCSISLQNDFARQKLNVLVNLCEEQVPVEKIMDSIARVCTA